MDKLNRQNYSNKTISVFEIVGAYFVDIFYNHLYLTSKKNHKLYPSDSRTRSLTDEYKLALDAYYTGITKDQKYYEKTIKGILESYRTFTKFSTISMSDFIDDLLQQYLPEEHFKVLNSNEKFFFLNKILTSVVEQFINKVSQIHMMKMIIDDHDNENNTRQWVDAIVDIQIIQREETFNMFIKLNRGKSHVDDRIDAEVVKKITEDRTKLWKQVQELLKEKCVMRADLSRAKKVSETLYAKVVTLEAELLQLKKDAKMKPKVAAMAPSATPTPTMRKKLVDPAVAMKSPKVETPPAAKNNRRNTPVVVEDTGDGEADASDGNNDSDDDDETSASGSYSYDDESSANDINDESPTKNDNEGNNFDDLFDLPGFSTPHTSEKSSAKSSDLSSDLSSGLPSGTNSRRRKTPGKNNTEAANNSFLLDLEDI